MLELKQSTSVTLKIGPFVDETDGKTAETGLTIAQADVRLSKNGGNMAQKTEATSCTHDEIGVYGCPLDTTDTGTLGRLQLFVHESGALPVWHEFMVLTANDYDSKYSTDYKQVDVVEISGDSGAADNAEAFFDGTGYAGTNNVIPTVSALTGHTAQTGDNYARLGAPAGASVSADVVAVKAETALIVADTNEVQTDLADGGRLDLLVDAIKAKTDNLPADPADDSDIDTQLAAIKAETALIVADTNELQTDDVPGLISTAEGNVRGADSDTLKTLSDQIDGIGGDATAANQTTIITHLTDVKGTGFVKDTDSLVDLGHIGADGDTLETLSDQIDGVGGQAGAGAITFTYTLTSSVDGSPIADANVWVRASASESDPVIASGTTDQNGQVVFYLDAGTVYLWRQKSGWKFADTNPDTETVA